LNFGYNYFGLYRYSLTSGNSPEVSQIPPVISCIYTLVPHNRFSADIIRDINIGVALGTVAYVVHESGNIIGFAFSIQ